MLAEMLMTDGQDDGMPIWEPFLRSVVADALGLECPDALPGASLVDDFAVDSLDLVEIAGTVEERLGVPIENRALQEVRSYGDLVSVVTGRLGSGGRESGGDGFSACCMPPPGRSGVLVRSGALAPYDVELLEEDCLALGAGSRLEVKASSPEQGTRRWLDDHLGRLRRAGVEVLVSWSPQPARSR